MRRLAIILMFVLTVVGVFESLTITDVSSAAKKSNPSERKKPSAEDVPFASVDKGNSSGIATRESIVVKDEAQWLALWKEHASAHFPVPPAPQIDFGSEMVIAVFAGEKHSKGYAIQVERIRKADGRLLVVVGESQLGQGSGGAGGINPLGTAKPFNIVRLAQSSLPVIFQGM